MTKKLEWEKYEDRIKEIIYFHAQNNPNAEVLFKISEIDYGLRIDQDEIEDFKKWLINKGLVKLIKYEGHNLFWCVANDSFLQEELNKKLFN